MNTPCWQPSATIDTLRRRAGLIARIRHFFAERNVLEVETPVLARYSVTDPHMQVLSADNPLGEGERYYLQSSPEYAMKRLLAAGSGPIFQLSKSFRSGEQSRRHNPEFTMLEWYRPGFDHVDLMAEVEALVAAVLACDRSFDRLSYRELFQQYFDIDPHCIDCDSLQQLVHRRLDVQMHSDNKDDWLNVLLAEIIEPALGQERPVFIVDYPESQSALAKIACDQQGVAVAQRFELYVKGIELANGYFELTDPAAQQLRLQQEQKLRQQLARPTVASDLYLQAAMATGLPECAGVALGVDRLIMLALAKESISDVLAFPVDIA